MGLRNFLRKRKYLKNVKTELNYFEKFLLLTFLGLLLFHQTLNIFDFKGELTLLKENLEEANLSKADILNSLQEIQAIYTKVKPLLPKNESNLKLIASIDDFFANYSDKISTLTEYSPAKILAAKDFKIINQAIDSINQLNYSVSNIALAFQDFKTKDINITYRNLFFDLQKKFIDLSEKVNLISSNISMLSDFAGLQSTHRYLFLIQNNAEIRTTGGFTGMLAIVEVSGVEIQKIDVMDIYELDGQYLPKIEPPKDLVGLNKKLYLRDLNYLNNKEAYIELLLSELSSLKLPSFDTVLMVNQSFFSELLDFLPKDYLFSDKLKLNSKNYFYALTMYIEANKKQNNDDKKIIKELLTSLIKNIKQKDQLIKLGELVNKAISKNDLYIYPLNIKHQENLEQLNLKPKYEFKGENNLDTFQVNFSSVGGNKTDLVMDTNIKHTTSLSKNDTPLHKVVIEREHNYTLEDEIYIDSIARSLNLYPLSNDLKHILIKGDNKVFAKAYIPIGSKVVSVKINGKEVDYTTELSASDHSLVVYVLIEVKPFEKQKLELDYESGFKLQKNGIYNYTFNLMPPNGLLNYELEKKFTFDKLMPERMFVNKEKSYDFDSIQGLKTTTEFKLLMSN